MKKKKALAWIGLSLAALLSLGIYGGTNKFAAIVLHPERSTAIQLKKKGWTDYTGPADVGLRSQPVSFFSPTDNVRIKGWFIPPKNRGEAKQKVAILLIHGRGSNKASTVQYMPWLHAAGYALMAIDLRGHWESGGSESSMGLYEPRDIRGAIQNLQHMGYERVVVMGFSMGATSSLMTAAQKPAGMVGVIAEAGFIRAVEVLEHNGKRMFGPVVLPFIPLVKHRVTNILGTDIESVNLADRWPKKGGIPALIIQSELDEVVPPDNADRIVKALGKDAELYRCKKSSHVRCHKDHPKEFQEKVLGFLARFERS